MKKTISITISGIVFHIEEDGYETLKNYLESNKKKIIAELGAGYGRLPYYYLKNHLALCRKFHRGTFSGVCGVADDED